MMNNEFRYHRMRLRITIEQMAAILDVKPVQVRRMETGLIKVTKNAATILRLIALLTERTRKNYINAANK